MHLIDVTRYGVDGYVPIPDCVWHRHVCGLSDGAVWRLPVVNLLKSTSSLVLMLTLRMFGL